MKTTPLTAYHEALNAKMAAFAGYNMPISYTGIKEEHHAVRQRAGIFDVSHMGEFIVRGKQALDFVQYVTACPMKTAVLSMICWYTASKKIRCTCWS